MQKPQPENENFVESSRSILHNADQEFVESKRTTEIGAGTDMEFVQTHYSPRGVLLLYFRGDAAAEVDKHFDRTLWSCVVYPAQVNWTTVRIAHIGKVRTFVPIWVAIALLSRKKNGKISV